MKLFKILKKYKVKRQALELLLIFIFLLIFNFFLYKIFSQRALSFGCFDDCLNYMGGYFMVHGKELYSDFFFNHMMGMAWLSFFIQKIHPSINLYDLVLTHRQAIMFLAFLFDILIIKRFKWTGLWFVVMYEFTKFYIFGDRFLAESVLVYAAVYMTGLIWEKTLKKQFSYFDFFFSGFFTWLIIFMREPYIPLALFLYIVFLWGKLTKKKVISAVVFLSFCAGVLVNTNIPAFYFNDVTVNLATVFKAESGSNNLFGPGGLKILFYPVILFYGGKWNIFRLFELTLSLSFLTGIVFLLKRKKWKSVVLFFIILSLSNIRYVVPGQTYFEAYHSIVWYGTFLFFTLLLSGYVFRSYKKLGTVLYGIIFTGFIVAVFSPGSYMYDNIDLHEQLLTNFGKEMNVGNVVKHLSAPTDTLFLDGADDMIYWQSGLNSPYTYGWYTSVMPQISVYRDARVEMFKKNPPVFYYDFCSPQAPYHTNLPKFVRGSYQQLYSGKNPTCLYVLKKKIPAITSKQWEQAKEGFFNLPN